MASTRAQQSEILRNQTVLDQLAGCLLSAAYNVLNEAATATDHVNRLAYANVILSNPGAAAAQMAPGLMTNPTLQGQAGDAAGPSGTPFADSDVDYVVASLFSKYADWYAAQQNIGAVLQLGA